MVIQSRHPLTYDSTEPAAAVFLRIGRRNILVTTAVVVMMVVPRRAPVVVVLSRCSVEGLGLHTAYKHCHSIVAIASRKND